MRECVAAATILLAVGMLRHSAALRWTSLALIVLMLVYYYSHYGFASTTAHITAMFPAFLAVAILAKVPPYLAALVAAIGIFDLWGDFRTPRKQENL